MINIHHLELFYYVARHGGITEASRRMPYGIGPSTLSKQMSQLEDELGAKLFERRPFELTPAGETLFTFIRPFFEHLPAIAEKIRGGLPDLVRLAASPIVLRDYLPSILKEVHTPYPKLRFTLREGLPSQIEEWLGGLQIDLAVTMLEGAPPAGCHSETLLRLPMVLLVSPRSKFRSASDLWKQDRITERLICPKPEDVISRCFSQGLSRRRVEWPLGIEVNSIELVEAYVAHGFGVGVSLTVPGRQPPKGLRVLPLPDFPKVEVGMLWQGKPNPVARTLMDLLRKAAHVMSKKEVSLEAT